MKVKLTKKQYKDGIERWAQAIYMSDFLPFYSIQMPTWKFVHEQLKKDLRRIAKAAFDEFIKRCEEDN